MSQSDKKILSTSAEVSTDSPVIDVCKYGFVLCDGKMGYGKYEIKFPEVDMVVMLIEAANMYSLYYWQKDNRVSVAERYIVNTQEQFDFLILNGRVGYLFKQQPMSCPA